MDVTSLDFADEHFDSVVDKGTMDSLLCGEGSTANVSKMCAEVSRSLLNLLPLKFSQCPCSRCLTARTSRRTLKPKGVFIVVSYGIPDNRLSYLEVKDYGWTVTVKTVPKPTVSAASVPDTKDATSVHYVYIMQKSGSSDS